MPRFEEEQIRHIKELVDIVDVVGHAVDLRKRGRNEYVGLCPFHVEKTPSFKVSSDRQRYHCFGCGADGDAIEFVQEHESLGFVETMEYLAELTGQALHEDRVETEEFKMLMANNEAMEHYMFTGRKVVQRFMEHRGLPEDLVEQFGIGYAGMRTHGLTKKLPERKNIMVKTGLLYDDGNERFGGRILFPIIHRKYPVGFGGRATARGVKPKYLNSKESQIYVKSKSLYGLGGSKSHIRKAKAVYVVEGYTDVLALWAAGIKNVVATCGTAFTDGHARLLVSLARSVNFVFDPDLAGRRAAFKAVKIALKRGIVSYMISLPKGKDPADIYQQDGGKQLVAHMESSRPFLDHYYEVLKTVPIETKIQFVKEVEEAADLIADKSVRGVVLREISDKFGSRHRAKTSAPAPPRAIESQVLSVLLDVDRAERVYRLLKVPAVLEKADLFTYLSGEWKKGNIVTDVDALKEKFQQYKLFIDTAVTSMELISDSALFVLLKKIYMMSLQHGAQALSDRMEKAEGASLEKIRVRWEMVLEQMHVLDKMGEHPPF